MLLCWLQVRSAGGELVLRIEDVDRGRSRAEATANIVEDLAWLGFDWDEYAVQSERFSHYEEALEALSGRTYGCTCSRKEIRVAAGVGADHRGEIAYPGTCRHDAARPEGPHSVRARTDGSLVAWVDQVVGPCSERPTDFIVRAKNGDHVYQLACVADDIAMGITHVLRGADLLDSTGRQLLLYRWLGAEPPTFAHVPLRVDDDGDRLAKSKGSPALTELREQGAQGEDVLGRIAADLGLLPAPAPVRPDELIDAFVEAHPELCP